MNEYLRTRYGDPCRICGYSWSTDSQTCLKIIGGASARFDALLSQRDGSERRADLEWNARGYVAHVGDMMRIWAERLAGAALGPSGSVAPYDEEDLGEVRGYTELPLRGSLWSLERATGDWQAADALAERAPEPCSITPNRDRSGWKRSGESWPTKSNITPWMSRSSSLHESCALSTGGLALRPGRQIVVPRLFVPRRRDKARKAVLGAPARWPHTLRPVTWTVCTVPRPHSKAPSARLRSSGAPGWWSWSTNCCWPGHWS